MATAQYIALSKRIIDRLSVEGKDAVFWDRDLPGFGIRVYPSGAKVYVVQTRTFGRSKRVTVGRHGRLSADQARKETARIIARIKAVPALGDLLVGEVERKHNMAFQYGLRDMPTVANRWEDLDFETGEMRLEDSKTGARWFRCRRRPRRC